MADLFQTSRTNVVEHIANIYAEGELTQEATCREIRQVRSEGGRQVARVLPFYNLDLIIDADEPKRLNTLVSADVDAAEFRAMDRRPTYMKDWLTHLEQLTAAMGGKALKGAGSITHQQALANAESEHSRFRTQLAEHPSEVETAYLETAKKVQKHIAGKKRP